MYLVSRVEWSGRKSLSRVFSRQGAAIEGDCIARFEAEMSNRTIHHTLYTIHHKPLLWTANIRAYCVQYSAIEVLCEFWEFVAFDRYFFSLWKLMKFSRCFFIFTSIRNFSIINIMRMLCAEPNRSSRKWCDEFIGETQHITNKIELNIIAKTEL